MNETSNVVRGILSADGTLKLDQRPSVPAGPVEVTIRPLPVEGRGESLWQYMQRTRAELVASGRGFRTVEEIDADLEDMRDWDGDVEEIHRKLEEGHHRTSES